MTGAGIVQTGSASDFETLYAGYRWDGESPQMYYVRNRFLLPMIGTWNRMDPLGYVDGMGLYGYASAVNNYDPFGLWGLGKGQHHHWVDKDHVGNLADLCGSFLEKAFTTAEQFREMLTTWVPGGWGKGEPHETIHNPLDDERSGDELDEIFGQSQNCCEAMLKLRALISDRFRELTLGEGSQGPVRPSFEWYPRDPLCPTPGAHIDTSKVLNDFITLVCNIQPLPRQDPIWLPTPRPVVELEDVAIPVGTGLGIWAVWEAVKAGSKCTLRAADRTCGLFFYIVCPPGTQYGADCNGPAPQG